MQANLYFSNQLLPLALRLERNLVLSGNDNRVLDAPLVIVPNMNLAKWIKLTLSRHLDVFMNVSFAYLEDGLWQMIDRLSGTMPSDAERLDRQNLTLLLFFILLSLDAEDEASRPIARYLRQPDGGLREDIELRCWQLGGELSRLFLEYDYHRADMIRAWQDGVPCQDGMEACQQALYRKMQALKTSLALDDGGSLLTMSEFARRLPHSSDPPHAPKGDCPSVHFFGLSQISPFHIELLDRLKAGYEIHIYSLNPSREYWEDIKTPLEKKWIARKKVNQLKVSEAELADGDLFSSEDHDLLSAWGKPGRENIRLLCQLTDYDFDAGFADPPLSNTVLSRVQRGILTLGAAQEPTGKPPTQDTSLQILACPGIRREVETVYNSILNNLENDPELAMTDIAVMVSDMARYKPVVDSVFGQMPGRISYNLVDAGARTESLFAQAVLSLMELSRGAFSRKAVFAFLQNPCVQKRWQYTPEALTVWVQWADALGIFHGYENRGNADGATPEAGLFSWRQGLERLRLARIMTVPESIDKIHGIHFNNMVPFTDLHTGDLRLLEKFCMLIPALHTAVSRFKIGTQTARAWRNTFFEVVDRFIHIDSDMRGEETVYRSLLDAFDSFLLYDKLMDVARGEMLTVETLWAFVRSHLEGISGGQGDYLTGGVTVSALMPMRPIPFKIVYVMGLEEGRFPGRATDSLLDLRLRKRRIGDVSLAERNRYLFLEILISVNKKLYLSYVSRDLQKDRTLEPCSVVHQLRRHVERQVLGGEPFKMLEIPIKADSPRYLATDAINAWSDALVNHNWMHRISACRLCGDWPRMAESLGPSLKERIARYAPDISLPALAEQKDGGAAFGLHLNQLRRFLLDPVAVAGQYRLGAYERMDDTGDLAQVEDEPLASCFPVDYQLRTAPIETWLGAGLNHDGKALSIDGLAEAFDAVYRDLARRSKVPAREFAALDHARLRDDVQGCGEALMPVVETMRFAKRLFSVVLVGPGIDARYQSGGAHLELNPVTLTLGANSGAGMPEEVSLGGSLPWVWQAEDLSWHCLVITGSGSKTKHPDKYILTPCLTFMAAAAGGESVPWSDDGAITVHVAYRNYVAEHCFVFDSKSSTDALLDLIEDFFSPGPLAWLPFDAVFGSKSLLSRLTIQAPNDMDYLSFAQQLRDHMQENLEPAGELYGAMVPDDILDLARRRFGAFLPIP